MISICDLDKCTGCWSCFNACPKRCISMEEHELYHLYPAIDQSVCVDCGACKKVCPVTNPPIKRIPSHTYACWAINANEYKTSTSGGLAAVLSRHVIQQGGVVYGCACLKDANVQHVRIDNEDELSLLKGSKYVQSSINGSYRKVESDLRNGRSVLFIGTPCQIAGLKGFLKKDYENLFLVDLICHGVPSLGYLKKHLKKVAGVQHYDSVHFREGNGMYVVVVIVDGKEVYRSSLWNSRYEDTYYNAFIDGYTCRPSCHSCQYADSRRISDITLGDFWGLKNDIPLEHSNGVSCMLVNTDKGNFLVERVKDLLNIYERELDEAVKGNDQLREPKGYNLRIIAFLKLQKYMGIEKAYRIVEFDHIHHLDKKKGLRRLFAVINRVLNKTF